MILFDLDGTLVDTAPDLGFALNLQRERHGLTPLPQNAIRPYASHGSRGLLFAGFNITPEDENFSRMREEYLNLYDEVFTRSPVLFEGVDAVLNEIENKDIPWGIVTNKPRRFSEPLINALQLQQRVSCLVCGDDAARAKPYPDTLLMACQMTGREAISCVYVGDAERDVQAGRAAGMKTVIALFGYIDVTDKPEEWGADAMISQPGELLALL
ncbi:MAG: phosphoglycolate phosphatase [Betaproteobacteria bacterium HGW-Betaproteobacteria-8]|nr:MAG: phosphoglycolate phosphatase [Betaproteobacteria bacterium HGW-Betaproteobacteria-8]